VIANIASSLLEHYRLNARQLPWRAMPGEAAPDPYRVWLSEVMLQQTTVATVGPRFARFVERWPSVKALAAARDEDVLSEWAGLGYYARARNLIACARAVAANGGFPRDETGLRTLPGLGAYTSAAIAAIAFGQRAVVVDTNVERVVARLFGVRWPVAEARSQIRELADRITPDKSAGDFAQAMMDLGATICRPKAPRCGECPLRAQCAAFASGEPEAFPAPKVKRPRPHRLGTAWWTEREGCVWLVRRPAKGLLGGMAALPGGEWGDAPSPLPSLAGVAHGFTHFTLDLAIVVRAVPNGEGWWQPLETIAEAGLPTLYRNAIAAVLARQSISIAA
jgi:A/G-specific adenine glycosylase